MKIIKLNPPVINPSWRYLVFFFSANLILTELHEQTHIQLGYILCSCYGNRDFNTWTTCASCNSPLLYLTVIAGPVLSYLLFWLGAWLFKKNNRKASLNALGFTLLFGSLPFARIFTAIIGGGDEKIFFTHFFSDPVIIRLLSITLTLVLCLVPILICFRSMKGKRIVWLLFFCMAPLLFGMIYQRLLLGSLLKKNIFAQTHLLGTPDLVLIHLFILMVIVMIGRNWMVELFGKQPR